jgi:hypothetical protein
MIHQDHSRSCSILEDPPGYERILRDVEVSLVISPDHSVFGRILSVILFSGYYCPVKSIKNCTVGSTVMERLDFHLECR